MGLIERIFKPAVSRRRFLQATATSGAAATLVGGYTLRETQAQVAPAGKSETKITKNICGQCPARCGVDVSVTDGRVHAVYGADENPIANGKLCPKGHLGTYFLYDPDRFKSPMKRTNPKKGRDEDPKFVPISWDEAFGTVAARLQALRDKGESHRAAALYGRGWGPADAGLFGPFGKLYGSPNFAIGHASLCAEGSKRAKKATDGNDSYNSHDYERCNNLLIFGAGFLEAFRPYNHNMQMWGVMRSKSPRTKVTVFEVRLSTTGAAADRNLYVKPGTDGAVALAIAHVMLTEGLWEKTFVGDFADAQNRFKAGEVVDAASFKARWTHGLVEWWNAEVKDRTPKWAEGVSGVAARDIVAVAREFGTTRPAMAIFERGPTSHSNGTYNGMAIHALNALSGSLFAEGGLAYQMGAKMGDLPVKYDDFQDDYAKSGDRKKPRIDLAGSADWPMAGTMMQEVAKNSLAGKPYKLDTAIFYYTNPIWSAPDTKVWEQALAEVFVVDTSPFPGETAMFADIIMPDHTPFERLQPVPTYPFQGWPMVALRVPAIKPLYDTKEFGDIMIGIGKRMKGPMGEYYKAVGSVESIVGHLAKGFADNPGTNGVNSLETWKQKGVWFQKPYHWRQVRGEFFEWDGQGHNKPMKPEEVKAKLLKTPSGKFEFKSGLLEANAEYINKKMGVAADRVGFPQWVEPRHSGAGDLYLVTPKTALHAEGRGGNIPHAIALAQPSLGGRNTVYLEINPETAKKRGIKNNELVRIKSPLGTIEAIARHTEGARPDTVVLPMEHGHWAGGRWAKKRLPGHAGDITANQSDAISGLASYYTGKVSVERA